MDLIPPEVLQDCPYDTPKITTRSSAIATENDSEEGTIDTYGTILSSLYYGTDNEAEVQSEVSDDDREARSHRTNRPVTYAQVTRTTPSTVSQMSGWTDRRQEEFSKLQEQHSDLEQKFQVVTEELCQLRSLLERLLTQNQASNGEPPNKKQATFQTPQRSERRQLREVNDMDEECGSPGKDPKAGNIQHMQE
jgi:hypothetical protein